MGYPIAGYSEGATVTPREIMYSYSPQPGYKPGGIVLDGAYADGGNTDLTYEIRAGWPVGLVTATGRYRPTTRTQVNGTSGAVTAAVVDNAGAFKVGDAITIGGDAVTLTAVDYVTNTLTWVGAVTIADNDVVIGTDGSQTCRGFLADTCTLRNSDNTAAANCTGTLLTFGHVNKADLLGDVDAIIATAASHFLNDIQIWSNDVRVL